MGWVVPGPETCLLAVPGSPSLDGASEGEQIELRGCKTIPQQSPGIALLAYVPVGAAPALLQGFGASLGAALYVQECSGAAFPK